MARNRGVVVDLRGLCDGYDPRKVYETVAVFGAIEGHVSVFSRLHDHAVIVFVFAMRTTLMTVYFSEFATQIHIEAARELRDRLQVLAALSLEQQYTAYADGMMLPIWREVLLQEADGNARCFFLTIPQFDADIDEMRQIIQDEVAEIGTGVEGMLIGKEPHADGSKHTHCLLKTLTPCRLNIPRLWGKLGATGQVQRVIDEAKVAAYISKSYSEGSRDYFASGSCALPSSGDKQSFNDILDELVQSVLQKKVNPWTFLNDRSKNVRLTAFRNRKSLEQLWFDVCRMNANPRIPFHLPPKPKDKTFIPIWDWMRKLESGELRNPKIPNRHLFLSGTTGTRKSNFASMLSRSFDSFHFDVNDEYYDGYTDGRTLGICDEFHIDKPGHGKDLPNLNRFLEGASGQLLNIKYQKGVKCDTTLPCLFVSNLTKNRVIEEGKKYFDIEIVKAFIRRFVFVDIGSKALPAEFTLIGAASEDSKNAETQTDNIYFPPFIFTSAVPFDHITLSTYLAVPIFEDDALFNCCKLEAEFRTPEALAEYDYILVSKNKQAKNAFTNPFNSLKALAEANAPILKTLSNDPWRAETIASCSAGPGDDVCEKETNCTLFPSVNHITLAVIRYRDTKPITSWHEPARFYLTTGNDGRTSILLTPEFILYDAKFTAESTVRAINHKTRALGQAMLAFSTLLGTCLRLVWCITECAICRSDTKGLGVVLACSHVFHLNCVVSLLHSKFETCPLCKTSTAVLCQMQDIYKTNRGRCGENTCIECANPWGADQCIVGCTCEHCQQSRRELGRVFGNS